MLHPSYKGIATGVEKGAREAADLPKMPRCHRERATRSAVPHLGVVGGGREARVPGLCALRPADWIRMTEPHWLRIIDPHWLRPRQPRIAAADDRRRLTYWHERPHRLNFSLSVACEVL